MTVYRPLFRPESNHPTNIHAHAEESPRAFQAEDTGHSNFFGRAESPIRNRVSSSKKRERAAQDEELIDLEGDFDSIFEEWLAESDNLGCKHPK